MSFEKLPARISGYATYELVEKLLTLSTQQRAAIDRIVQHCYVDNHPLAELLRGDDKICSEVIYYRRGVIDEAHGGWKVRPGWSHDKEFVDALETAARLALSVRSREELAALQTARRRARLASGRIIDKLFDIATQTQPQPMPNGSVKMLNRMTEDKDSIAASKVLLDYANAGAETEAAADAASSDEADWWKAGDDGE